MYIDILMPCAETTESTLRLYSHLHTIKNHVLEVDMACGKGLLLPENCLIMKIYLPKKNMQQRYFDFKLIFLL